MEYSASVRLPAEGVGWVEGGAAVMLKHDSTVEVGSGRRASSIVGAQHTRERNPVSTPSALLCEPLLLVARVLLATKKELADAANSLRLLLEQLPRDESLEEAKLRGHLDLAASVLEKMSQE
jgi:hypothetical protein